jgi:LuxR family maltose regulon positive regulatory protein
VTAAQRILTHLKQMDLPTGDNLQGQVATAEAYLSRSSGDMQKTIELSKQALRLLPEDDKDSRPQLGVNLGLITWHQGRLDEAQDVLESALAIIQAGENEYLHHTALLFLARTMACRGDLDRAASYLESAEAMGDRIPTAVLAHCDSADILYIRNQLDRAWEHLRRAQAIAEAIGNHEFKCACCIQEALFNLGENNVQAAATALEPAIEISRAEDFPPSTLARINACRVQIALAQEDLSGARKIYESIPFPQDGHTFTRFLDLNQARLLMADNDNVSAKKYMQTTLQQAKKKDWNLGAHLLQIMMAVVEDDPGSAIGHLEAALETGEPMGSIRPFLPWSAHLTEPLKVAARRGRKPAYVRKILSAMQEQDRPPGRVEGLIEALSDREMEVLRLVAAGLSNRQIAEQLVISLGTAKSHIHHIFNKLDVSNRTEAVTKAQHLGLL